MRIGVGGVDVRSGAVVRQAVGRCAISQLLEPVVLEHRAVIAVLGNESWPHADHGVDVHGVQLLVHAYGIGPLGGIHVHLAHLRVVEPVNHQRIEREMAIAVALGNGHQFRLARVPLLALDKAVRGSGQHGDIARQQPVPAVDLVVAAADDHEKRDPLPDIGGPAIRIIEAKLNRCAGGIVPQETVAFARDNERHTDTLAGGSVVVMSAAHHMAAPVKIAFLRLSEPIGVLVARRGKSRTDGVKGIVGRSSFIQDFGVAILVVRDRHLPSAQVEQGSAFGRFDGDAHSGSGPIEESRNVGGGTCGRVGRALGSDGDDHPRRAQHVSGSGMLLLPVCACRLGGDAVPGRSQRCRPQQTEANANDIGSIGFDKHGRLPAGERQALGECGTRQ